MSGMPDPMRANLKERGDTSANKPEALHLSFSYYLRQKSRTSISGHPVHLCVELRKLLRPGSKVSTFLSAKSDFDDDA